VGGSEAKKGPYFYGVFLTPLTKKRPKICEGNREKIGFGFFVNLFVNTFRHEFFVKCFCRSFTPIAENTPWISIGVEIPLRHVAGETSRNAPHRPAWHLGAGLWLLF
jgi:hypothetical protein